MGNNSMCIFNKLGKQMQINNKIYSGHYHGLIVILILLVSVTGQAHAEYGDVVINNYSDEAGIRPVVFPHWFHRIRFRCKVCHGDLGFEFKAGGNDINMVKIIDGQYCGACHNGEIAWSIENCNICHSAPMGIPTQVHDSTLQKLIKPEPIKKVNKQNR